MLDTRSFSCVQSVSPYSCSAFCFQRVSGFLKRLVEALPKRDAGEGDDGEEQDNRNELDATPERRTGVHFDDCVRGDSADGVSS